jgi:hypothetical protein
MPFNGIGVAGRLCHSVSIPSLCVEPAGRVDVAADPRCGPLGLNQRLPAGGRSGAATMRLRSGGHVHRSEGKDAAGRGSTVEVADRRSLGRLADLGLSHRDHLLSCVMRQQARGRVVSQVAGWRDRRAEAPSRRRKDHAVTQAIHPCSAWNAARCRSSLPTRPCGRVATWRRLRYRLA